jgi:phosphoglucosamine mutase
MGRYFGTDGIRGVANQDPLTPEMAFTLGRAAAYLFTQDGEKAPVVLGKDTRLSGDMLEAALCAGLCSAGVDVLQVGVMPTPAVAYLTRALGGVAGIVISASHNPFADNGIKFFGADGFKLSDAVEESLEGFLQGKEVLKRPVGAGIGKIWLVPEGEERYMDFALSSLSPRIDLRGMRIVVDCANGAAFRLAPELLKRLGATVYAYHTIPNGTNINEQCGALHPETLSEKVRLHQANIGLSFDGDADRLIAVDEEGTVRDGDYILLICMQEWLREQRLTSPKVVGTVMSNVGVELGVRALGGEFIRAPVGDRYVLEEMLRVQAQLGGEQSGHIIFLDYQTTGDGIITALQLLQTLCKTQHSLSVLSRCLQKYPQVLVNIPITERKDPLSFSSVQKVANRIAEKLGDSGRLLVRLSGTELVARVMVEGPNVEEIQTLAHQIGAAIRKELG